MYFCEIYSNVQQSPQVKTFLIAATHGRWTKLEHPFKLFREQRIISSVGPELHRKQKSSRFVGSQTKHLKVGSERQVSGTHLEWNVRLGRQIPVQVIKFPCTVDSLAPHLAHNSLKLSLASSSSAAIVAPSQPGITGTTKPTPCSNLFANWKKNANCIRVQIWGYK